jgi:hypothetical protein
MNQFTLLTLFRYPAFLMKNFFLLAFFLPVFSTAQIKVSDCRENYLTDVAIKAQSVRFTQQGLLAAKPAMLPANFTDTLKKYDWYELNSYSFTDHDFQDPWGDQYAGDVTLRYDFLRFEEDSTIRNMFLFFKNYDNPEQAIYASAIDQNTAEKLVAVKTAAGSNYMATTIYSETKYQKIVSYVNGVMIKELTKSGKIGAKQVMYRIAYMAVEKEM